MPNSSTGNGILGLYGTKVKHRDFGSVGAADLVAITTKTFQMRVVNNIRYSIGQSTKKCISKMHQRASIDLRRGTT